MSKKKNKKNYSNNPKPKQVANENNASIENNEINDGINEELNDEVVEAEENENLEPVEEVKDDNPVEGSLDEEPQEEQPVEENVNEDVQEGVIAEELSEEAKEEPEEAPVEEVREESQESPIEESNDEPIEEVSEESNDESQEEPQEEQPAEEEPEQEEQVEESNEENEEAPAEQENKEEEPKEKKKKEEKVVVPVGGGVKPDEFLADLDKITGEYRIFDYIDSGYPFFEYDLIDVLRSDLEKVTNEDFEKIFNEVLNSDLIRNYEVVGMFIYFAKAKNFDFGAKGILNKLPNINNELTYYYASLNAIHYNNKQLVSDFKLDLQHSEFAENLLVFHKKYKVYKFFDSDDAYKSLKKIIGLYKRKAKKLAENEKRVILRDIFDIYGLSAYPKYADGLSFYEKNQDVLDNKDKEYALLRLGHNFVIHFEFKKAIKTYERILTFTADSYNAHINLMLAKNNVRIYGELTTKVKYYETEDFKEIRDLAVEFNNKAYTDRFARLIDEIKEQDRYETEYKMGQVRRIVSGFCYVLMVIILVLGFFIKMKELIIAEGILAAIIIGVQFLTLKLKKRLVPIIVFSAIALAFFILSIILI